MSDLAVRVPALEWAHRANARDLSGLDWVDTRIDAGKPSYRQVPISARKTAFRGTAVGSSLPPPVVRAIHESRKAGGVSGWEVVLLIFARLEWLVEARRYLWSPYSPEPKLLATLVETFGVSQEVHQRDGEVLSRLTALLPVWYPHRGTVARAVEVLSTCDREDELADHRVHNTPRRAKGPALKDEVMACRDFAWWRQRHRGGHAKMEIRDGFVRFQPRNQPFELLREDVLLSWTPGEAIPVDAIRLLPTWAVLRLAVSPGRNE